MHDVCYPNYPKQAQQFFIFIVLNETLWMIISKGKFFLLIGTRSHVMLHSPNVILGSVLAVQNWDIGICPKVMYRMYLGLIQM